MTTVLRAYHGDLKIKRKYLSRVRAHAKADEIIHGKYWENGKGCAVGCTIHGSNHSEYETALGIPTVLARLEDTLFEGQSNGKAKTFPARFLSAIKPGADLSLVSWKFLHWLLTEELAGRDHPRVSAVVKQCADAIEPLTKTHHVDKKATNTAKMAAWVTRTTAEAAVCAATMKAAARATAYAAAKAAARAAAEVAACAEEGVMTASWVAAEATWAAWAAAEAAAEVVIEAPPRAATMARSACYARMADKLIRLLQEAEVKP
jgi:hypothetical protein